MSKSVLITGGAGYIGSHTVKSFLQKNYKVVVFDNLSTGFREAIPEGALFIEGDLRDFEATERVFSHFAIDAVVHFAAKIVVPESIENPLDYYRTNILGTINLLDLCKKYQVDKFVFSSTAAVYGNVSPLSHDFIEASHHGLISEETDLNPISPYGSSKMMSEQIIRDAGRAHSLRSVVLRYFNVAGASQDGLNGQRSRSATHLIKIACEVALKQRPAIQIYGTDYETPDGTGVRDYVHVEDLATAHVLAYEYLASGGSSQVLNCGYGQGHSVMDVLSAFERVNSVTLAKTPAPRRLGDVACLVADNQKIVNVLN